MNGGIIHIHWAFAPTTGGVESHLWDLARHQADRGWRVTVLTGEEHPDAHPECEVISTHLLDLRAARAQAAAPRAHTDSFEAFLAAVVEERQAAVIHGHNLHHFSPAPALAIEALRTRLGISAHHTFHETWPDVLTDRPVYRAWEGTYAISRFIQQQCDDLIGFRPELLSPGVDTDLFRPDKPVLAGGLTPVIFHPARLLPWKGVHVSVSALRKILDTGLQARLVLTDTQRIADWDGELPAYRRQVLRMVEDLGLTQHVSFIEAAFTDMPKLYNQADIVLYPTVKSEPFGLVPPEAMSCGRPVVATRCGGIVETVEHEVTGFLVEPENAQDLADHIAVLLQQPDKARAMGVAGRRRVEQQFSLAAYVVELEKRYMQGRAHAIRRLAPPRLAPPVGKAIRR